MIYQQTAPSPQTTEKLPESHTQHTREFLELIALVLVLFVIMGLTIKSYRISNIIMQPTLSDGEAVFVNKIAYTLQSPQRGDVIALHNPISTNEDIIERIIAIPGDTITLDDSSVQINGVTLHESYAPVSSNPIGETIKLQSGQYFVMGDNRLAVDDSRQWGPVPRADIVGKVEAVTWPISRWHILSTFSSVFAHIGKTS